MTNIAIAFREEINRLARREIRRQLPGLKKASAQYRSDIAELKRRFAALQTELAGVERQLSRKTSPMATKADAEVIRFNAKGLRSQRKRLGFSAADYGRLIGVSAQTIYSWEQGNSRPRKQQLAALKSARGISKKDALARL